MIAPGFLHPPVLAGLRATYLAAGNVLLLPEAVSEETAAAVRERYAPLLREFYLADRGRYHRCAIDEPLESVRALVEGVLALRLGLASACLLRLQPGDYSLLKDSRTDAPRTLEATLDLSPAECAWADVTYVRGRETVAALPHVGRSLTLVDRDAATLRHERYLSLARGPADVWRLRLALVPAT